MLATALERVKSVFGKSQRQVAQALGYKSSVVLSHMASGRVPIPLDKAVAIARELQLPESSFLRAVLQQRHPEVDWQLVTQAADPFASELERLARKPLSALSPAHHRVLRDVVRDSTPEERWLSIPEIATVQLLRELFPKLHTDGLSVSDGATLRSCIELLQEHE
jgi:transcriptional regulator with XRE-family HTH domain